MKNAWALAVVVALAGCSQGGSGPPVPDCAEDQFLDEAGACVDHVEPHIVVTGLAATVQQYRGASFSWSLDPGTRGMERTVHSMDSRIVAFTDPPALTNTTEPPAGGTDVARQQHKDLPGNFSATFRWDAVGLVHLKGYMLIDGKHVWQDLQTIDVTQVMATGNVTATVTVSSTPPHSVSPREAGVVVGDAVRFTNDAPYDYTIAFSGTGCPTGGTIPKDGGEAVFDFLAPGPCDYVLSTPLGQLEEHDPGRITGKVTVSKPQ